jgi:PAS domain S-box-containing protein
VFDQSLRVVVVGGVLIIAELLTLLALLELAKRQRLGSLAMGVVYVGSFVGILTLDGVLFPSLVLLPPDGLGAFIESGVRAKLVLAGVYAVPLAVFVTAYRRVVDRFEATPLNLAQLVSVSRDGLLDRLDEQQAELAEQRAMLAESTELAGRTAAVVERILDAAITTLIVVTDAERRITRFNRGGQEMLGYTEEEVLGRTPAEVFHSAEELSRHAEELGAEDVDDLVRAHLARGTRRDWVYTTRDGGHRTVSLSVTPIHDGDRLIGYLGVGEDVSERVSAEQATSEALQRELAAVARLEEADRVKDELVSTISHELRTPITTIQGFGELLAERSLGDLTNPQEEALAKVLRNATRLEVLIDDLLVMAQSERGELTLNEQRTDLRDVVRGVEDSLEQLARGKDLDVRLELGDEEVIVLGDPAALERVVLNLGGNAVKFTPDGGEVVVSVRRRGSSCELVVSDTGIGVSEEDQTRMFTRFFRSGEANRRAIPGPGLGLSVVHTLVTQHGGEISVSSTPGAGTRMVVLLPAAADL